jgi:adenylate cyclase 10
MESILTDVANGSWSAHSSMETSSNPILTLPLFENAIASNLASPQSSAPTVILPMPPVSSLSPQSTVNLCSYIPSTVVQFLARHDISLPARHKLTTAVLFADISGYTAMCELLGATHAEIEDLARIVKAYFGILVKVVQRHGGDVFKFAGDAVIVLWPEADDSLTVLARRCAQCALEIQRNLHGLSFQDSSGKHQFELSLRIGIGVGDVLIFHIGGVERRMEYLAAGSPLSQAFLCESIALPGTVRQPPRSRYQV